MTTRREFAWRVVAGAAAGWLGFPVAPVTANNRYQPQPLQPGQFVWRPEAAPDGAVVIIVSLPEQRVHVYRGGIEIGASACSSGKPGHRTPTGVFTILEKQRKHVSSIYKGAQMPNMERLTWGGIALHAGNLPGYPASHGCVRLPLEFSARLFEVTHVGTVVIIADELTQPRQVVHPGPALSVVAASEARALERVIGGKRAHTPWEATISFPVTSVMISRADGMAFIWRNGKLEASYAVGFSDLGKPIGTHVYSLVGPASDGSGLTWLSLGLGKKASDAHIVHWHGDAAMRRVRLLDPRRAEQIAKSWHPGTTLLITDAPTSRASRSTPKDFSVIASDHAA